MAYAGTPTVTRKGNDYIVTISETEAGAATEATITGLPRKGRVMRYKVDLTAGSGATVDPVLGTATNPAGSTIVVQNDTAADPVDLQDVAGYRYYSATGTLYHRSVLNAGSDNSVTVQILISADWD